MSSRKSSVRSRFKDGLCGICRGEAMGQWGGWMRYFAFSIVRHFFWCYFASVCLRWLMRWQGTLPKTPRQPGGGAACCHFWVDNVVPYFWGALPGQPSPPFLLVWISDIRHIPERRERDGTRLLFFWKTPLGGSKVGGFRAGGFCDGPLFFGDACQVG